MRINHNIAALNTHRQLNSATTAQSKSMEKLASGMRINKAGDDAAGLAISEKMRGQIRGLDQASKNSQDGISMIATAEGALNETHDILQRMKELATQAANGTNTESDRGEIQKEVNQLTSEINRIGNTTEFNTQKVLDGGASANGVNAGTTDANGIAAKTATITGNKASVLAVDFSAGTGTQAVSVSIGGADYSIDDSVMKVLWGDGTAVGFSKTNEDLANILSNYMVDATGAKLGDVANVSFSDTGVLSITNKTAGSGNDVKIEIDAASDDFRDLLGFNTTGTTTEITADGTNQTEAKISGSKTVAGGDSITAADWAGKSFTIDVNGTSVNATIKTDFAGTTLADLATEMTAQFASVLGTTATVKAAVSAEGKFEFTTTSSAADKAAGTKPSVSISGDNLDKLLGSVAAGSSEVGGTFNSKFQIGANQGQSFEMNIADMRSQALKIAGTTSGGNQATVDGAKFTEVKGATNGTDSTGTEYALDVTSFESASAAIKVLDNAIQAVSAERSNLGASQNRLEHTINNLNTSSENLTAAESRVRDVDMAKEMMEQTKNSILAQASQAMLAQANQLPQGVLQLLR